MDICSLGWIIVIIAGIASAIVRECNPKEDGFWCKVCNILNYISVFNPSGTVVIPYDDEYIEYRNRKKHKEHKDVESVEHRE